MEESISSSPYSKSNKSIYNVRNIRKSKRKSSGAARILEEESSKETLQQRLYQYSDDDSYTSADLDKTFLLVGSRVSDDYEPFKMERMLCLADRGCFPSPLGLNDLSETSQTEFQTCQKLSEKSESIAKDNNGSFVITDSELLNCCHEVDEMLICTPPKELCLVNTILEDFSLSPLTSTLAPKSSFWEYSPEFIVKSKPAKTYSRRKRPSNNGTMDCNKRLEFNTSISSDDEDCLSNNSSFLSIQENHSQLLEDEHNTTVIQNLSERFNENLLNLSAFYTQEASSPSSETLHCDSNESETDPKETLRPSTSLVLLLQEISTLRQRFSHKHLRLNSFSSEKDFYGFSGDEQDDDVKHEISLSEDYLDETQLSPHQFHIPDEDREMVLCTEYEAEIATCEGYKSAFNDSKDEWNEDFPEVFALIRTQEVLLQQKCSSFKNGITPVKSTSETPEIKSDVTQENSKNIKNGYNTSDEIQARNRAAVQQNSTLRNIDDIPSTSTAPIMEKCHKHEIINDIIPKLVFDNNAGFKTANGKKIDISSKGTKAIEHILKDYYAACDENPENDLKGLKSKIIQKNFGFPKDSNEMDNISGTFQIKTNVTHPYLNTSHKAEEANSKNSQLTKSEINEISCKVEGNQEYWEDENELANVVFSEWPLEEQLQSQSLRSKAEVPCEKDASMFEEQKTRQSPLNINTTIPNLAGFKTAGGNKVEISAKAKMTVANLLQEFQTYSDINICQEDLIGIKNKIQAKNYELKVANKSCNSDNNSVNRNNYPSCSQNIHSPIATVKRTLGSERTPSPPPKKISLDTKDSFTKLSVTSPLNASATNSIISRKNLLSLSKKRKQKSRSSTSDVKSSQKASELDINIEVSLDQNTATPTKKASSDIPPAPQTPWTPNLNEFFQNASKSSTPQLELVMKSDSKIENDFKPISWDNSIKINPIPAIPSKISDETCSNVTLNSTNPNVNERLERLQMYGNAPAISPIAVNTPMNCRASGLRRRTRSMLKKPPNN